MKNEIVILLKKIKLYIPTKNIIDTIRYFLFSENDYYNKTDKMYSQFDLKDKIIYDIGAADNGIEPFLRVGAKKVIGVEPVIKFYKRLLRKYKNNDKVEILNIALGDKDEDKEFIICNSEYFSTFSKDQINMIKGSNECKNLEFYKKDKVQVRKLDTLIKKYGIPYFCKIDVEGYELEVLKGLTKKIPLISFEYNTLLINNTIQCIFQLEKIGEYEYNFTDTFNENMESKEWISSEKMIEILKKMDNTDMHFGDVYARLNSHYCIDTEVEDSE